MYFHMKHYNPRKLQKRLSLLPKFFCCKWKPFNLQRMHSRVFKPKEFDFAARFFTYDLDQSHLQVNTNVDFLCLNLKNLRIIKCIKILAEKSNWMGLKSL